MTTPASTSGPASDSATATPVAETPPAGETTWTFIGHWEGNTLVVESVLPGDQQDTREDTGYWSEGLWAGHGTGPTREAAMDTQVEEYDEADEWRWAVDDDDYTPSIEDDGPGPVPRLR